jgi:hypothetical protein
LAEFARALGDVLSLIPSFCYRGRLFMNQALGNFPLTRPRSYASFLAFCHNSNTSAASETGNEYRNAYCRRERQITDILYQRGKSSASECP